MNGVDFVTSRLMQAVGGDILWYLGINVVVLLCALVFLKLQASRARFRPSVLVGVLVESTLYAFVMGRLAVLVLLQVGLRPTAGPTVAEDSMGLLDAVVLSIGAGTYEELVFRVGLLWGSYRLWATFRPPSLLPFVVALVVSSLVFSGIHYAPFGMDDFNLWSFFFRAVLGVMFGLLFWFRGFAVAVYTHAIYDIVILVPRSLGLG
jgi:membrane protease YdiL (CAAX protease family)